MDILIYTLKSLAYMFVEPYWIVQLIILFLILYRGNKKIALVQRMIMGRHIDEPLELTMSQIVLGIFAGTAASIIMAYLGIAFNENSMIALAFLVTIFFLIFSPHFASFAYSASFLALTSVLFEYIAMVTGNPGLDILKIDVAGIMNVSAIIIFMEGILTIIDGKRGSVPVFTERDGKIAGGFVQHRFWLLPIALLFMTNSSVAAVSAYSVQTPDWWPLLKLQIPMEVLKNAVLIMLPFFGITSYSCVTFTKTTAGKALESGVARFVYGIVVFILAQFADFNILTEIIVPLAAVAVYAGIMAFQRKREIAGKLKYVNGDEGIMILQVLPDSPGDEMGLKTGDVLMAVNNINIRSEQNLLNILKESSNFIWMKVKRENGFIEQINYNKVPDEKNLGLLLVPNGMPREKSDIKFDGNSIKEVVNKIKKRDKSN